MKVKALLAAVIRGTRETAAFGFECGLVSIVIYFYCWCTPVIYRSKQLVDEDNG